MNTEVTIDVVALMADGSHVAFEDLGPVRQSELLDADARVKGFQDPFTDYYITFDGQMTVENS